MEAELLTLERAGFGGGEAFRFINFYFRSVVFEVGSDCAEQVVEVLLGDAVGPVREVGLFAKERAEVHGVDFSVCGGSADVELNGHFSLGVGRVGAFSFNGVVFWAKAR